MSPLLGLVLAGGRSRRFGRDKAAIEIDGETLLARIFKILDGICADVFVSVRADQVDETMRSRYALIVDAQPELGPAGGILAAHGYCPDAAWLVTACDMPLLDTASIHRLVESRRADKAATSYRSPVYGGPEPLCAIWEPATLEKFRQRVESAGGCRPRDMLDGANIELIDAADVRTLTNVNTLADFDRLESGKSARPS